MPATLNNGSHACSESPPYTDMVGRFYRHLNLDLIIEKRVMVSGGVGLVTKKKHQVAATGLKKKISVKPELITSEPTKVDLELGREKKTL